MSQPSGQSLTFAEYSRKYGIPKYAICKEKSRFQIDPGFDTEKIYDNEDNKEVANQIGSTRQVRPNALGQKKPRNKAI